MLHTVSTPCEDALAQCLRDCECLETELDLLEEHAASRRPVSFERFVTGRVAALKREKVADFPRIWRMQRILNERQRTV